MFKITTRQDGKTTRLMIEGRLAGPWVAELESCWQGTPGFPGCDLLVDLTEVTFIDQDGKELLSRMWREGARLHASGCLTRCIVEEITGGQSQGCDAAHRKERKQ